MTNIEVKTILGENREIVISFFDENCKVDSFYTLRWFMERVMSQANSSWGRRKNVTLKEVVSVMNMVLKNYPQIKKGHVSNYQKAVNYFGAEKANQILNAK